MIINELLEIKNFYSLTETKIKLIEQVKKFFGKEIAPNFNSFDFWYIDENKVSEIIAFFLDPNESHEHGNIYLKHFLKKFNLDFFKINDNEKINVQCEFYTDNGRRIDILIYKENFKQAIAIENKINIKTADQKNQINDYMDFISKKTNNNYCMIYISPEDKILSENSINYDDKKKTNKLKILTYEEQMIDCINDFGNLTQNIRVKSFLKDFEKTLRRKYMGEKNINTQQVISDFIIENEKNIKISFFVSNSLKKVKKELKEKFEKQIQEIGKELNIETNGLRLRPSKWSKNQIAFSYESGGILYGIVRNEINNNKQRLSEIDEKLEKENYEKFYVSGWWPMWQFFYSDIDTNEQFWIDIYNGKAKERAKKFIKLINDNFNIDKY